MKAQKLCMLASALSAAILSMGTAQAADVTTEDVKVTAGRVEQELMDVPMSVSVVTSEEIEKSSARTIGELLEDIPGVQIVNSGSQGLKRLSIRGENSFRTLVMIDGQKLSEQKSMDGTAILIDPATVERIEVIKGPASVLYGSDAIGGAINIITKKGGTKPFGAEASVGWNGAGNGWSESASIAGSVDRFKYRLSGNYMSQDNLDTPRGELEHTAFRQKSASLFLSYDITDNVTAGITADTFDSHLRSGSITYAPEDFFVDIPEWKRNKVGAFIDAKNINDYLTRVRFDAYWQKTEKKMNNFVRSVDNTGGEITMNMGGQPQKIEYSSAAVVLDNIADNRLTTIGTSLQTDWQLGDNHYLIAGYEFSRDSLKADTVNNLTNTTVLKSGGSVVIDTLTNRFNKGEQNTHSIFASMESTLPLDFVANYGVRFTYVDSEMSDAFAHKNSKGTVAMGPMTQTMFDRSGNDDSAGKEGSTHNSRAVFNAGITYTGFEDTSIRATWAQGFRSPLLQEMYITNTMGGGTMLGNPDLDPETSNNFELGVRYTGNNWLVDATAFYSMADDYITTEITNAKEQVSKYFNADKAKTHGLELAVNKVLFDHYTPYATVTWMRRKIESADYSTYDSGTPEFFARYGLRTNHQVFGGTLTTDTYARSQTSTKSYSPSTDQTTAIGGFTTFNFAAGYSFGPNGNYSLNAEFLNIFDQLYQYNTSTYEAGRHFNVKLTARY